MVKYYNRPKKGMKKAKNGKFYYPRRARPVRRNVRNVARNQALALKITKKKVNTVQSRPWGVQPTFNPDPESGVNMMTGVITGATHWQVFNKVTHSAIWLLC